MNVALVSAPIRAAPWRGRCRPVIRHQQTAPRRRTRRRGAVCWCRITGRHRPRQGAARIGADTRATFMTFTLTPVLTANWGTPESWTLDAYRRNGGYGALGDALKMAPDALIQLVKDSGLRGRGGAGFPTGMKWGFIPQGDGKPHYLVVNADESEPGTCKDIPLMMASPHTLLEGVLISAYAIRANRAFIYVRGEVLHVVRRLLNAVDEAKAAGLIGSNVLGSGFDIDVVVHIGAGAYICGEETALLESLEGFRGQPRLRPPFPAIEGLYACPTVINNVETCLLYTSPSPRDRTRSRMPSSA